MSTGAGGGSSQAARDALVAEHLGFVRTLALQVHRKIGRKVELDELVAYGARGLVEAAERFDGSRGASFQTFAYYRIRGAIYDGLREMGWLNRTEYARHKADERADAYLGAAADAEAARRAAAPDPRGPSLEDEVAALAEAVDGLATIFVTSLDALAESKGLDPADPSARPVDERLADAQDRSRIRAAIARLPEKERRLMELHYYQDLNLLEAGKVLGLSKSWASRLHARAVDLLRAELDAAGP